VTDGWQLAAGSFKGTRTVLEYLLSPVQKVAHEAGRER
jgi:hemolysin D